MLELKTDDCGWCKFVIFFMEHCVSSGHQSVVLASSIEWNGIDETVGLNEMLLNGSTIPNFIDRLLVGLAEFIPEISRNLLMKSSTH